MKRWLLNSTKKFINRPGYTVTDDNDNVIADVNMKHPNAEENARTIRIAMQMKEALHEIKRKLQPLLPETLLNDIVRIADEGLKHY